MKLNLKDLLEGIYAKYPTKEASFQFFLAHADKLGVLEAEMSRKAVKLRPEKTASTQFLPFLKYNDFGNEGKVKDVIDRIQEIYECGFVEAVKMLLEWENEPVEELLQRKQEFQVKSTKEIFEKKEIRSPYTQYYIDKRKVEAKENPRLAFELLKKLCRGCSGEEYKRAVKMFNIGLITMNGYHGEEKRLFIPEYDENGVPWGSFSYNRDLDPKGKLRKDSKRVLFGSHLMKHFNKNAPIIFTEGHSDCIVNNAKLYQSVTTGSATTPVREYMFPLLEGKILHFFPDADRAGMKGVMQKLLDIEIYNSGRPEEKHIKYKVYWWSDKVISKEGELLNKNFWITMQEEFFEKKSITPPPEMLFKNWIIIKQKSKEYIGEGYDFIDFHSEYQNTTVHKQFMSRYSYSFPS